MLISSIRYFLYKGELLCQDKIKRDHKEKVREQEEEWEHVNQHLPHHQEEVLVDEALEEELVDEPPEEFKVFF